MNPDCCLEAADHPLDGLVNEALADGVFSGAAAVVLQGDRIRFSRVYGWANRFTRRPVTPQTYFDLASLTKPLATTLAVLHLVHRGRLALSQPLKEIDPVFKAADKGGITVRDLLRHTAGFAAHRPYYHRLVAVSPHQRRARLRQWIWSDPLDYPLRQKMVYSDLGFIILAWVVEMAGDRTLDQVVRESIYEPLGIRNLCFLPTQGPVAPGNYAATAYCPWRRRLLMGVVHDDNAYMAGGVEGHAGLFGTLGSVAKLTGCLLQAHTDGHYPKVLDQALLRQFMTRDERFGRALGFDVPKAVGASCGKHFSYSSVGHLGYSGTSLWIDLQQCLAVVLLTNRIHPHTTNTAIREFRPRFHDLVFTSGIIK